MDKDESVEVDRWSVDIDGGGGRDERIILVFGDGDIRMVGGRDRIEVDSRSVGGEMVGRVRVWGPVSGVESEFFDDERSIVEFEFDNGRREGIRGETVEGSAGNVTDRMDQDGIVTKIATKDAVLGMIGNPLGESEGRGEMFHVSNASGRINDGIGEGAKLRIQIGPKGVGRDRSGDRWVVGKEHGREERGIFNGIKRTI